MAEYSVQINWIRDDTLGNDTEGYIGNVLLNYPYGNSISGTWGNVKGNGLTKKGGPDYWNMMTIDCDLFQGSNIEYGEYDTIGQGIKYYPGRSYSFDIPFTSTSLIQADRYYFQLEDLRGMFKVGSMSLNEYISLNVSSIKIDKPSEISRFGDEIFNDINIRYSMISNNYIDYQVIQNGDIVLSKNNHTGSQILIPKGTFKSTSSASIKMRSHFNFCGTEQYSEWINYSLSGLKGLVAEKPQNIRLVGTQKNIEDDIVFEWDTEDTRCSAIVEIWQDGIKVISKSGVKNNRYVLPAGTLKNPNAIKVRVSNTISVNGYSDTSAYSELQVSGLTSIRPIISDFLLSSNNRDYDIEVTVTSENTESFELYYDGRLVVSNTSNQLIIPAGTLLKGQNSITVKGIKNSNAGKLTGELTKQFNIVQDEPIVYSIEPSNININIEEVSIVSFNTNAFVSRWEMYINNTYFTNGTSERSISVSPGYFNSGENSIKVVIYYSPSHDLSEVRNASKTVVFTGYGRPQKPKLDAKLVYDTATPTFTWTLGETESDGQVAFEIKVHEDHKTVNTSDTSYTMESSLNDKETYTVRVRIKNKYEMWSSWSEKTFETVFSNMPKPLVKVSPQRENVLIEVSCEQVENFSRLSLYRSTDTLKWVELANDLELNDSLIDYLVQANTKTFYKARVYDNAGGFKESDIKSTLVNIRNYNLLDVKNLNSNIRIDFASITFTNNFKSVIKKFSNSSKPLFYKDKTSFITANMTVKLVNNEVNSFIDFINNGDIFCYRDYRGKKMFVAIDLTTITYINPFLQELVLNLTEVNFNESLSANKANYGSFVYANGEYYLDGVITENIIGGDL